MSKVLSALIAAAFVALSSAANAQSLQVSSVQHATFSDAGQSATYASGPYDSANMSSTLGN